MGVSSNGDGGVFDPAVCHLLAWLHYSTVCVRVCLTEGPLPV